MARMKATPSAYDLTINGLPLTFARGAYTNGKPAFVRTVLQPLKAGSDEFQVVQWQNGPAGAGWTRETPASMQGGGHSHGENVTTQTPGIVMPTGKVEEITIDPTILADPGIGSGFFDAEIYDGDLWVSSTGRYLAQISGGTALTAGVGADLGVGYESQSLQVFDGNLLVSGSGSGSIWSFDGSSFTQGTSVERSRLADVSWTIGNQIATGASAGGAGDWAHRLVATDILGTGFYHLASGADPLVAANWSSLYAFTASPYAIQDMVASNHTVWFSTPAGVWGADGLGYAANLTPWMQDFFSASSGAAVLYHDGYILYGHAHGLAIIPADGNVQDIPRFVQFGHGTANGTPIYGRPYAMDTAGSCVYVAYGDAGATYVGAVTFTSEGPIWSMSEWTIEDETPTMLRVMDLGGRPYLLLGTLDGGTPRLRRKSLPITGSPYADWLQGTAHEFTTESSLTLSKMDLNDSAPKEIPQYEILSENLGDGRSISVNVSTDGAAYVTQGTVTESPREVVLPEVEDSSGTDFQIRLDMRGTATEPCVLRIVGARVSLQPEPIEINEYTVMFRDQGEQLRNAAVKRFRNARSDFREALALPRAGTVTVTDHLGDELRVRVRATLNASAHEEAKGKPWTGLMTLRTVVIERIVRYDDGHDYDTGVSFGAGS
jgi:hypothetical protein